MIIELTKNGTQESVLVNMDNMFITRKGPHGGARISFNGSEYYIDVEEDIETIEQIMDDLYDYDDEAEEAESEEQYDLGEPR